ncbi:MAG: radical SAM protein [Elusimicrobiota bacterium]|nr:radical SAM protein [Elusimicrobiota bacterium]
MVKSVKKTGWISEQLCVQAARTCNLYCVYCQNPPTGESAEKGKTAALIKKRGVKAVSLEGGGEPTAGRDFFDWIRTLKAAGVANFMLSTNAVALSDPEFCRRAEKAVDYFTVNFPASDPETYRKATRSVKFGLAVKGLENLKALGAENKIRLFHIIFKDNYRKLPAFADWVIKKFHGVAFVNFTFVRNAGRVGDSAEIVPRYTDVEPFLKVALARLKLEKIKVVVQNVPLCRLRNFEGFSFEFQRWRRGDRILEAGIAGKAKDPACVRCSLEPACCGARADYLKIHGSKELVASAKDPKNLRAEAF